MGFPTVRLRRLRRTETIRSLVRGVEVNPTDLIAPIFIVPGSNIKNPISSLEGQYHLSVENATMQAQKLYDLGIPAVILFGIPDKKDELGSYSWDDSGIIQQTIRAIKKAVPELIIITDLCFCEYTSHGHCGVMKGEHLDNDISLKNLVIQALSHARAGADMVAPSGMLDGTVKALRQGLDESGFIDLAILGYSIKFASSFYGPFRAAAQCAPSFGDRRTYQMDPANYNEAIREMALDVEEGADIVMVKPALAYLDVIRGIKDRFELPTCAYNVSGEYAMVKAAAGKGWIDGTKVMLESLTCIKRAGADMIITYFAEEFAELYRKTHFR